MISLADRSEASDIRYEVFQIIERIMTSKSLDNLMYGKKGRVCRATCGIQWNLDSNTIDCPSGGSW